MNVKQEKKYAYVLHVYYWTKCEAENGKWSQDCILRWSGWNDGNNEVEENEKPKRILEFEWRWKHMEMVLGRMWTVRKTNVNKWSLSLSHFTFFSFSISYVSGMKIKWNIYIHISLPSPLFVIQVLNSKFATEYKIYIKMNMKKCFITCFNK